MFATELHIESEQPVEQPTLEQIEDALMRIDGSKVTFVGIKGSGPETSITVGGGADGKYVVTVTYDNEHFFTAIDPTATPGMITMVAAGQPGHFDAKKCIDRARMLRAVRTFATTGERDSAIKWSRR